MAYIHIYQGNPTSGSTNGTLVSEGTGLSPITTTLNATNNEISSAIKLAVRCDTGFFVNTGVVISPTGTSASKWCLSADGITFNAYGASLTINGAIGTTNTIFYAKAKAVSAEIPQNDTSVDLVATATVNAS